MLTLALCVLVFKWLVTQAMNWKTKKFSNNLVKCFLVCYFLCFVYSHIFKLFMLIICIIALLFLFSHQKNTVWITSAGATWSLSTASVTTSSMESSAASPAPARSHRALTPLCPRPRTKVLLRRPFRGKYSLHTGLCAAMCFLPGVLD